MDLYLIHLWRHTRYNYLVINMEKEMVSHSFMFNTVNYLIWVSQSRKSDYTLLLTTDLQLQMRQATSYPTPKGSISPWYIYYIPISWRKPNGKIIHRKQRYSRLQGRCGSRSRNPGWKTRPCEDKVSVLKRSQIAL